MVAEHITNLPSDKQSGKRGRTQMLVAHSAETPLAAGFAASVTVNWLNKWYQADGRLIEASINTFFGPDTTVRAVNTDYASWHASWANQISVGYEFTGYAALTRAQWLTEAGKSMLDRAGREMAADAKLYGIPLRWLTTDEVNQICNGNTAIRGLATHRQIDPINRTDPGDGFPYDVLMSNIQAYTNGTTPTPEKDWFTMVTSSELRTIVREEVALLFTQGKHLTYRNPKDGPDVWGIITGTHRDAVKLVAEQAAQRSILDQLAKGQGVVIDYAKLDAAIAGAVDKSVKDAIAGSISIEGTVVVGGAK